jgi:hypothetical protein
VEGAVFQAIALALAVGGWAQSATSKPVDDRADAEAAFAKLAPEIERAQAQWEQSAEARAVPVDWTITRGLVVQRRLTGGNRFNGKRVVDVDLEHEEAVRFGIHSRFSISAWILARAPTGAIVCRGKDNAGAEGYGLYIQDGKVQLHLVQRWLDDALRVETERAIELNQWHNVTATYDGSGAAGGIGIFIDGRAQKVKVNLDSLHGSFETKEPLWIGGGGGPESHFRGQIRMVRIYNRVLRAEEAAVIATETPVSAIAQLAPEKRTPAESEKIRLCFLERASPANIREAWQRLVETREK